MTAVLERIALNKLQRPMQRSLRPTVCQLGLYWKIQGGNQSRPRHPTFPSSACLSHVPVSFRCLLLLFFSSSTQDGFVSDSHQLPPSSLAPRPCSSSGVHTSGFYHVCCCSCFPSISPTGQLPPLSFFLFCFSIPVCNSLSLVALILPPTAPRNALPFLSLDLFLRVQCVFQSVATRLSSYTGFQNHFLFALPLFFLILSLPVFCPNLVLVELVYFLLSRSS